MADRNTVLRGEQIKDATVTADELASSVAGVGISGGAGTALALDLNELSAAVVDVSADSISIVDATDSSTKKESIADLVAGIAGTTLTATAGVLTVTADSINATHIDETATYDYSSGIVRVATPVGSTDAANKSYVDGVAAGLDWKDSVRIATTGSIANLSAYTVASQEGVTLVAGDRILVKDTASADGVEALDAKRNGIYIVGTVTAGVAPLTRATDADASSEVTSGLSVFVEEGTTNADAGFVLTTNDPITLDTTGLTFTQFTGLGQITAGNGLTKTGNTIDLDLSDLTAAVVDVSADSVAILDATDSSTKVEAIADIVSATAGVGLAAASGALSVDLNELTTEATFDPAADFIGIVDATDSGSDKSLWSVIATAIAGTGITATNGVLSADTVVDNIVESDFVKSVQIATASQTIMTSFSGSAAVVANSVQVYLNGLIQEEGAGNDYTIVTSTGVVTFLVALDAGDIVTMNGVLDN